jgi:hypothetical protein
MTTTSRIEGLETSLAIKAPVKVATTANIVLSGLQTIDGIALLENDRVLVKNQTLGANNGIYLASTGEWVRAQDWNGARDAAKGTRIFVTDGSTNSDKIFYITTNNPIVIGTTVIVFAAEDTSGFDAISPITQLGDIIYGGLDGVSERLGGNITTTRKFLSQTGDGSNSASPSWQGVAISDLPTVTIAKGGTGETVKAAAFDALAPSTTKGDLIGHNGTDNIRLPVGADGAVLVASSASASGLAWDTVAGGSSVFDDSVFRIQDNSDSTKKLAFETSGISTGTTRTLTPPNASDTIVGATAAQTLTNKTLTSPVISSISNIGTLTLPTSTDTLVGRATTDTLTNKTLVSPTITGGNINATTLQVGGVNVLTAASIELDDLNDVDTTGATVHGANYVLEYSSVSGGYTLDTVTGAGEVNTASNVGASGAGVFKQKTGTDLEFKKLVAGSNVTITGGTSDITISGGAGGGASALNDLTDVVITSPSSGQVVKYDGSNWVNATVAGAFGGNYTDLTEVNSVNYTTGKFADIYTIDNGRRLQFNHTNTFPTDNFSFGVERFANQTVARGDGNVCTSMKVRTVAANGNADFEWNLTPILEDYGQGENCAFYATGKRMASSALYGTWAGVFELRDITGDNLSPLCGLEIDILTNGMDNNRARIGLMIINGRGQLTGGGVTDYTAAAANIHCAMQIESFSYDTLSSPAAPNTMVNGILIGDNFKRTQLGIAAGMSCTNGLNIFTTGSTGIWDRGVKTVGILLEGTYTGGNALRIPALSTIGFDINGIVTLGFDGTWLSANRGLSINANNGSAYLNGIGNGGWGVDMQAASLANGLIRGQSFEIGSGGLLNWKTLENYGTFTNLKHGGIPYSGRFIRVSINGRGTDAYIPIMVADSSNPN